MRKVAVGFLHLSFWDWDIWSAHGYGAVKEMRIGSTVGAPVNRAGGGIGGRNGGNKTKIDDIPISASSSDLPAASCSSCAILAWSCLAASVWSALPFLAFAFFPTGLAGGGAGAAARVESEPEALSSMEAGEARELWVWAAVVAMAVEEWRIRWWGGR